MPQNCRWTDQSVSDLASRALVARSDRRAATPGSIPVRSGVLVPPIEKYAI
jgi:hypothetical protein